MCLSGKKSQHKCNNQRLTHVCVASMVLVLGEPWVARVEHQLAVLRSFEQCVDDLGLVLAFLSLFAAIIEHLEDVLWEVASIFHRVELVRLGTISPRMCGV